MMRNEIKKTLSLGALCTMAFFAANSAFADYYNESGTLIPDIPWGGDYGVITSDKSDDSYYTYENWTSDETGSSTTLNGNVVYDNITVGAGSTYNYAGNTNSSGDDRTLTIDNLYVYGDSSANAVFTQTSSNADLVVNDDVVLNYGAWSQSAANVTTIKGSVTMDNGSTFNVLAGTVTVAEDFTIGTDSILSVGNGTAVGYLTVSGTMTLNDNAAVVATYKSATNITLITNLVMNGTSTYNMDVSSTLRIYTGGSFTINDDASFTKTTGTLAFQDNTSLTINGGSFSSNATTLNGAGTIYLALESVGLSGTEAVAAILGSIDLGAITFGTDANWSVEIDISVLDYSSFDCDFIVDFTDIEGLEGDLSSLTVDFVGSDSYTASLSGTTVSFTYAGGTAVPEPSTYAMIFGVVALGFVAYRRRK